MDEQLLQVENLHPNMATMKQTSNELLKSSLISGVATTLYCIYNLLIGTVLVKYYFLIPYFRERFRIFKQFYTVFIL